MPYHKGQHDKNLITGQIAKNVSHAKLYTLDGMKGITVEGSIPCFGIRINGVYYNMKELSMTAFRKMCGELAPAIFVYDSINQAVDGLGSRIVSRYTDMVSMLCPDRICFKNSMGFLCLSNIKKILYKEGTDFSSLVFYIICGNRNDDSKDISYTILVDKNFSE